MLQSKKLPRREVLCGGGVAALVHTYVASAEGLRVSAVRGTCGKERAMSDFDEAKRLLEKIARRRQNQAG
jgi:hypothetical protein